MSHPELDNMPPARRLIGIAYTKRVGKDTAADALVRDLGYKKFAFADELRELAFEANPVVTNSPGYQNVNIGHNRMQHIVKWEGGWERAKDRYPEVRTFLENLGMGVRKRFGEDFWRDLVLERARLNERAVVSDVRFINEAEGIKALGGKLVKLDRPGFQPRPFERELVDWDDWDLELSNDGSVVDLEQQIVQWAKGLERLALS